MYAMKIGDPVNVILWSMVGGAHPPMVGGGPPPPHGRSLESKSLDTSFSDSGLRMQLATANATVPHQTSQSLI